MAQKFSNPRPSSFQRSGSPATGGETKGAAVEGVVRFPTAPPGADLSPRQEPRSGRASWPSRNTAFDALDEHSPDAKTSPQSPPADGSAPETQRFSVPPGGWSAACNRETGAEPVGVGRAEGTANGAGIGNRFSCPKQWRRDFFPFGSNAVTETRAAQNGLRDRLPVGSPHRWRRLQRAGPCLFGMPPKCPPRLVPADLSRSLDCSEW